MIISDDGSSQVPACICKAVLKQASHGVCVLTGEAEPTAPLLDNKGVSIEVKKQAALQRRRQRELQKQHNVPATAGVLSQPTSPAPQMALEGVQGEWAGVSQGVGLGAAQSTSATGIWRTSSQASQGGARGLQGGLQAVAAEECVKLSQGTGVFAEGDDDAFALPFLNCAALQDCSNVF